MSTGRLFVSEKSTLIDPALFTSTYHFSKLQEMFSLLSLFYDGFIAALIYEGSIAIDTFINVVIKIILFYMNSPWAFIFYRWKVVRNLVHFLKFTGNDL